jgi:steroid delta-isomerase-like uncharacterized protein
MNFLNVCMTVEDIMAKMTRRTALSGVVAATAATSFGELSTISTSHAAVSAASSVAQKWIDGWNSPEPEKLVAAFTSDGLYRDVPFDLTKKGSAELRELHKFFHESVAGLYCKLIASRVSGGHGTIEWLFGGTDVGVYKTGKPFEVPGVSVIEVRQGRISRNLDYYDAATIMKQVGLLPAKQ